MTTLEIIRSDLKRFLETAQRHRKTIIGWTLYGVFAVGSAVAAEFMVGSPWERYGQEILPASNLVLTGFGFMAFLFERGRTGSECVTSLFMALVFVGVGLFAASYLLPFFVFLVLVGLLPFGLGYIIITMGKAHSYRSSCEEDSQ